MSILKTLSDDELIREIWNSGTEREREIVRRLERLHQQIDQIGRKCDDAIGGEPPESMFHVKQAD